MQRKEHNRRTPEMVGREGSEARAKVPRAEASGRVGRRAQRVFLSERLDANGERSEP